MEHRHPASQTDCLGVGGKEAVVTLPLSSGLRLPGHCGEGRAGLAASLTGCDWAACCLPDPEKIWHIPKISSVKSRKRCNYSAQDLGFLLLILAYGIVSDVRK